MNSSGQIIFDVSTRFHEIKPHNKKTRNSAAIACVEGVKRGRGNLGVRERVGHARKKGKERPQGRHYFLQFLRSDSERENSDWSESIKCQSST